MASVVRFIEGRLRLKVNAAKSAVARPEERHFVGFRLRREPLDGSTEVLVMSSREQPGDGVEVVGVDRKMQLGAHDYRPDIG